MKNPLGYLTALSLCAAGHSHAAIIVANAETLAFTGGTFIAGTSTPGAWYGNGAGSSATAGNPGQFMKGAAFDAPSLTFVTIPAPITSEEWTITYDFIGQQNWSGNNRFYLIGLASGASLSDEGSLAGVGVTVINVTPLGAVAAWTSYAPTSFTIPAGLSAVAIGMMGNNDPAVFGMDNLNVTTVPEPSGMALFGMGAVGLMVRRRRI